MLPCHGPEQARTLAAGGEVGKAIDLLDQAVQGILPGGERGEAARLLEAARARHEEWKRLHPGASNL